METVVRTMEFELGGTEDESSVLFESIGFDTGLVIQNKLSKLTCDHCGITFHRASFLEAHMASHNKVDTLQCDLCGRRFHHEINLKAHLLYHQDAENKLQCHFCHDWVRGKRGLHNHVKRFHTLFNCEFCEAQFPFNQMKTHIRLNHKEERQRNTRLGCDVCGQQFASTRSLMTHQRSHDPNLGRSEPAVEGPSVKCELCGQQVANAACLKIHFRRIHLESECDKCGQMVANMTQHMRMTHSVFPSKGAPTACPQFDCQRTFRTHYQAQNHFKKVHLGIKAPSVECRICGKAVIRLHLHMDQVHGENRFECRLCGKFFPVKSTLERHIRNVHHPVKADCPFCEVKVKLFHLARHITSVHGLEAKYAGDLVEGISGKSAARTDLQWTAFSSYKNPQEEEDEEENGEDPTH